MVYTGDGDGGETTLHSGERISKNSIRIAAFGTVDELNSILGVCRSYSDDENLERIQHQLHTLQAELADREPDRKVGEEDIEWLEEKCDAYGQECPPLKDFVLPEGTKSASNLHHARSVCRRAERKIVALDEREDVRSEVMTYINRLSDLLFLMARHENQRAGREEENPEY